MISWGWGLGGLWAVPQGSTGEQPLKADSCSRAAQMEHPACTAQDRTGQGQPLRGQSQRLLWNSRDTEAGPEQSCSTASLHLQGHPVSTGAGHCPGMLLLSLKPSWHTLRKEVYLCWSHFTLPEQERNKKTWGEKCNIILFTAHTHTQKIFKSEYLPTAKHWGEKGGVIMPAPPGSLRACVFLWWLACGFVVHYSFPEPYILLKHKYRPTNLLTSWSIGSRTLRGIMLLPPWCSPLFRKRREKEREWKKKSSIV